jgi:hypothetical protein
MRMMAECSVCYRQFPLIMAFLVQGLGAMPTVITTRDFTGERLTRRDLGLMEFS